MKYAITLLLLFGIVSCEDDIVIPPDLCQCPDPMPEPEPTVSPIVTPTPVVSPTSPPPAARNPRCRGTMGTDGGGGFLWKPKSDATGATPNRLVVLFPSEFVNKFERVEVKRNNGRTENLRYTGKSNGERQTWRGEREGARYDGSVTAFDVDQECLWKVNNPGQRQD